MKMMLSMLQNLLALQSLLTLIDTFEIVCTSSIVLFLCISDRLNPTDKSNDEAEKNRILKTLSMLLKTRARTTKTQWEREEKEDDSEKERERRRKVEEKREKTTQANNQLEATQLMEPYSNGTRNIKNTFLSSIGKFFVPSTNNYWNANFMVQ